MKKLLLLGLMLLGLGGVVSVKAGKLQATLGTEWYCSASWEASTSTMSWNGVWTPPSGGFGSFYFINTGLPNGDITSYTKFHATLSDFSENVDHIWLRIKQGDNNYADAQLVAGENNIDLVALAQANPNVDFTQVTDITLWGANEALAGKAINAENVASVKIEDVYLDDGYENEYIAGTPLALESVVSNNALVSLAGTDGTILYGNNKDNQIYAAAINNAMDLVTAAGNNSTYRFKITEATDEGLVKPNGVTTLYRIQAFKGDGTSVYTGPWYGGDCYLNDIGWTRNVVAMGDGGEQGCFFGIQAIADKTNTYKITSYNKDGTVKSDNFFGKGEWVFYVIDKTSVPAKKIVEANDEIFAVSKFSDGKWTLEEPVNLYDWNYLVIGTENTAANASHEILLTDNNGKTVHGDDYKGEAVHTGAGMWLDRWNSQNIIAIDLNHLRRDNKLDVFNITQLEIKGDIKPSVVYLTDYANNKLTNRGRWDTYVSGDLVREYSEFGKFGTICLPYKASYAGCEIYSIASTIASGITLEKVTGLLEAGKPYFYVSADENGQNNEGSVRNVNFFRADFDTYDVAEPVENNGLIGTFGDPTAVEYVPQGKNYYVVGRAAGDTEDKIFRVDSEVTLGANRAYIDKSKIADKAAGSRTILLSFDGAEEKDPTAIESTEAVEVLTDGVFYDMSGREVSNLTPGLYIVKYGNVTKKVMIK